jgi:hypothetical protein
MSKTLYMVIENSRTEMPRPSIVAFETTDG